MAELVAALDFDDAGEALRLADRLAGIVSWVKVGLELYSHAGPTLLGPLKTSGFKVFLDLKMFDIPNTVHHAVLAAGSGADMLTVHTLGGARMCRAAMEAAGQCVPSPLIFGVTVLTSFAPGELPGYRGDLRNLAADLAEKGHAWGLDGVVCSGHEAAAVKARCGAAFRCLTPGIRPAAAGSDDQRRVLTPAQAVRAGADYLVVGRPILRAPDPVAAARNILEEMELSAIRNPS